MKTRTKLQQALALTVIGLLALPGAGAPSVEPESRGEVVENAVDSAVQEEASAVERKVADVASDRLVERPRAMLVGRVHVFRRSARVEASGWGQGPVAKMAQSAPGELLARL